MEVGLRREIQAGANAWRNVERIMMHRQITRKLKGKVLDSCIAPPSIYGMETLALSERQQHKLQGCEKNLVRIIAGVKRVERKTMIDMREEVGTKMYVFLCLFFYIAQYPVCWTAQQCRLLCCKNYKFRVSSAFPLDSALGCDSVKTNWVEFFS